MSLGEAQDHGANRWTKREDELLMAYYPQHGSEWDGWDTILAHRSRRSIGSRAWRLGIACEVRSKRQTVSQRQANERAREAVRVLSFSDRLRLTVLFERAIDGDVSDCPIIGAGSIN